MITISDLLVRPLALAALAALLLRLFRIRHPASQHAVWLLVLASMIVLPVARLAAPRWSVPVLPSHPVVRSHASESAQSPEGLARRSPGVPPAAAHPLSRSIASPVSAPWTTTVPVWIYLLGVAILAARQAIGWLLSRRLVRRSLHVSGCAYESADVVVPLTACILKPVVILPAGWREWPPAIRHAVLSHEHAHIRRRDPLTRALSGAIRCLFWFHPLAWWLYRRVQTLAEMACDAAAVERCSNPAAYCRILLQFAATVSAAGSRTLLPGLAIAGAGALDRRIDRIFAASQGGLRRLARPGPVLALAGVPALCLAASVDFTTAPTRLLFFFQGERIGRLEPELAPSAVRRQTAPLKPATAAERLALPVTLAPGDALFTETTFVDAKQRIKLALIEPASGAAPYVFVDVNRDGVFEAGERFAFEGPDRNVTVRIPMSEGPFRTYPIKLWLPDDLFYRDDRPYPGGRTLMRSPFAYVEGQVDVGGRPVLARYLFDAEKHNAYPDYGWIGMDTNGDGRIDEIANSDEFTFAKDEGVIFHVNGHDVSTVSLDLKAKTFVIRDHPAGGNPRIPLRLGEQIPDFQFTDLDGKTHQFREFKGRYVLLDFWGTWCGPCRAELPNLEKAYQQFRGRKFVVLGMDDDRDVAKARALLQEKGVTFPQSTGDMGNDLVYKRFRVNRFPTAVLIDPSGKIVSLDFEDQFRGENTARTLDRFLPPATRR